MILLLLSIITFNLQHAGNEFYNGSAALNDTLAMYGREVTLSSFAQPLFALRAGEWIAPENYLIIASGERLGEWLSKEEVNGQYIECREGGYDPHYAWACDFDNDACAENIINTEVKTKITAKFYFRNISVQVESTNRTLAFPPNLSAALKNASGNETLTINITVRKNFSYLMNNREPGIGSCYDNEERYSKVLTHRFVINALPAGEGKEIFIDAPVIGRQWFKSNKLAAVILSQSPLLEIIYRREGNYSEKVSIRNSSIAYDGLGFAYINLSEPQGEHRGNTAPIPLIKETRNYSFIYRINFTYPGLGYKMHQIEVRDVFNGSYEQQFRTESRTLVANTSRQTHARKNYAFQDIEMLPATLFLGILLILIFLQKAA